MSTVLGDTDYEVMDDTETVSYTQGTTTDSSVANAWHTPISRREMAASGGMYTGQEVVWHLPVALLSITDPREGDTITDASGIKWSVKEWRKEVGGTSWRLITVKHH